MIAVVVSRYSASITDRLLEGAVGAYVDSGGSEADLVVIEAPGSFELPVLCSAAAETGRFAGVVALGCIIKGETSHDQHLASAVAHGLVNISLLTGVPVSLGVLTVNSAAQARDRAGGKHGNKGEEAMLALLQTLGELARLDSPPNPKTGGAARPRRVTGRAAAAPKAAPSRRGKR